MRSFWTALMGVYTRWRFVEEADAPGATGSRRKSTETPEEEVVRLRAAISRERRNLVSFQRFDCAALAGPCESSIRAMESRIRALELRKGI